MAIINKGCEMVYVTTISTQLDFMRVREEMYRFIHLKDKIIYLIDNGYTNIEAITTMIGCTKYYARKIYKQYTESLEIPQDKYEQILNTIMDKLNEATLQIHYHTLSTYDTCMSLLNTKQKNNKSTIQICTIMCLAHDIGKIESYELHATHSYKFAEKVLKDVHPWIKNNILFAILAHSTKTRLSMNVNNKYENLLIEADILSKLQDLDMIGRYKYQKALTQNIQDIENRYKKLLSYKECLYSDSARELFKFLKVQFDTELKGMKRMMTIKQFL